MSTTGAPTGARLIGRGRCADVYDIGGGRVLRRFRDAAMDASYEGAFMRHVHDAGVPVPEVYDVSGTDIVMQRLYGPTMLADLGRRPWRLRRHARTLAELHNAVHAVAPAAWMRPVGDGEGGVLHLDLHPDNVILTPDGPMIIDWQNSARGPAQADPAVAWVVINMAVVPGPPMQRLVGTIGQHLFARLFLDACEPRPTDEHIAIAMQARLSDATLLPRERERILKRLEQVA